MVAAVSEAPISPDILGRLIPLTKTRRVTLRLDAPPIERGRIFDEIAAQEPDLRLELTAEGELIVMPPTGGETGARNFIIALRLGQWVKENGTGRGFDSSTVFILPDGSRRSPDAAWILRERFDALTSEQRRGFPPMCPDFVLELRSPTDRISDLIAKMNDYLANGARLGWLIDPETRAAYVFRPGQPMQTIESATALDGEAVLPGFVLDLEEIWNP
jgi:Uma2 family endonuclease